MVEHVQRPVRDHHVPPPVDVVEHPPRHLGVVMHVHVRIHYHDALAELHLTRSPQGMHHFARVQRIALVHGHQGAVVEPAFFGEVEVDQLWEGEPHQRQEDALGGLAQIGVFHGSLPHDGGGVDGITTVRERRQMEHRIPVGQGVVAGVVAERPFGPGLVELHVPLEHELRMSRHLQVDRVAPHQLHCLAPQETGEEHLVDRPRQRRRGGVGQSGVGADGHRHFHAPRRAGVVLGAILVQVPVHAGGVLVEHLQPVHAHVARTGPRMPGEDQGQGDVAARVQGPALEDGERLQIDLVAGEHHLLAGTALDRPRLQRG